MLRITWQGQELYIRRIVLGQRASEGGFGESLRRLANQRGLVVVGELAEPRAGDFWIGCLPERGWQDTDWRQIGSAGVMEARLALAHLRWSEAIPDAAEAVEEPLVMPGR